jgi:dihydrofolate synthase/folylpolyglutamate synthase
LDFSERVTNGAAPFPDALYAAAAEELITGMERIPPETLPGKRPVTWFELATLFAFLAFRRAQVDWAVYETGMGGRLDATNVLRPALSVITAIELEHTAYLGTTLEAIAAEKGGIIKPGTPVVIAAQKPEVRRVFEAIAAERNAELTFADDAFTVLCSQTTRAGERIHLESPLLSRPINATLALYGPFQAQNAALAALGIKKLFPALDEGSIEAGLGDAHLPGRFQIIEHPPAYPGIPAVVVDGAHTPASVSLGVRTFFALFPGTTPALIFACAKDKDAARMAPCFSAFAPVTLTRPGSFKQADPEGLQKAFRDAGVPFRYDGDYGRAIAEALGDAEARGQPVLAAGSFYLASETLRELRPASAP